MTLRGPYFSTFPPAPTPQVIQQTYIQPPAVPKVVQRVELPVTVQPNPYWVNFLNPPAVLPQVQIRTELPVGPPPNPYWIYYKIPQGFPTVTQVTSVPISPQQPIVFQTYLKPVAYPTVLQRLEVPVWPIINPYWTWPTNPNLFTSVVLYPAVVQRTENPLLPTTNPSWQFYLNPPANPIISNRYYDLPPKVLDPKVQDYILDLNLDLLSKDQILAGKQVWFVPDTPPPLVTTWLISPTVPPPFVPTTPVNQYNWPNPNLPLPSDYYNWVNFLTNIPQPPTPPAPVGGGRQLTEREVEEALYKLYSHRPDKNTVYNVAKLLGKQGGIKSGISRRGR